MTKEEVIKESWGENYNEFSEYIDSDGWLDSAWLYDSEIDFDVKDGYDIYGTDSTFIRPKSLQGIENNNGWIRIENEEFLPREDYYGNLFEVGYLDDIGYFHYERRRCDLKSLKWMFNKKIITHYQPIEKQKPPIF